MTARLRLLAAAIVLGAAIAPAAAQNYSNSYTFIKAVKDRDGAKVTSVLEAAGSTVGSAKETGTGNSALHLVALDRDYSWLSFLLGKGLKVDARNGEGQSALAIAAQLGWVEGAQLLAQRGAAMAVPQLHAQPALGAVEHRRAPVDRDERRAVLLRVDHPEVGALVFRGHVPEGLARGGAPSRGERRRWRRLTIESRHLRRAT